MITWPIFLALILAYYAVKYTIKMEEAEEEKEAKAQKDRDGQLGDNLVENSEEKLSE